MAEPFATVADYVARTGRPLKPAQETQVQAYLVDATALIRSRLPTGYEPDPDMARAIAVKIVRRAITNPGGLRSRMVGGWSESYDEDGGLYITDDEVASLLPDEDDEGQAYTVRMIDYAYGPQARHRPWWGHDLPAC